MIDVLISGRVRGAVSVRTGSNGRPFAIFRMAATDKHGDSELIACIAFSATVIEAAQRLDDGDSIAVSGEAAIKTWQAGDGTTRHGLDVVAHALLTAYHLGRKRKGAQPEQDAPAPL